MNLESALRHLRDVENPRSLWVDAICINQNDIQERNHQVHRMRDIYRMAKVVVAWLGPASEDSDLAMDVILGYPHPQLFPLSVKDRIAKECNLKVEGQHSEQSLDIAENQSTPIRSTGLEAAEAGIEIFSALKNLYDRSWWRRAWIIQEVVSSRMLILICGFKQVSWKSSVNLLDCVHAELQAQLRVSGDSVAHTKLSWLQALEHCQTPAWLLETQRVSLTVYENLGLKLSWVRDFEASDARDKLWIAISLLPSQQKSSMLMPNYSLSLAQTFALGVYQELSISQSLSILEQADLTGNLRAGLPSWVPDYQRPEARPVMQSAAKFQACGPRKLEFTLDREHCRLCLKGFVMDELDRGTVDFNVAVNDDEQADLKMLSDNFQKISNQIGRTYRTGQLTTWTLWKMVCLGIIPANSELVIANSSVDLQTSLDKDMMWSHETPFDLFILKKIVCTGLRRRRIFTTKQQYVGLMPDDAQKGDLICVVFGGEKPLLLRPITSDPESFLLVGACYLAGFMEGEAMKMLQPGNVKERTFEII